MRGVQGKLIKQLENELRSIHQQIGFIIAPSGDLTLTQNVALETLWRIYDPERIGVIDFHGSYRNYARENIGGINLSLATQEEQQKQNVLYNHINKYANIKTEMATEFVLHLLRKEGGQDDDRERKNLIATLQELFRTFFPGKKFDGPKTDLNGNLIFPVTYGDIEHDINELSSGEKEILYGYLRLRNFARRDSIILLDEPELHLNPKLIQGLPAILRKTTCI